MPRILPRRLRLALLALIAALANLGHAAETLIHYPGGVNGTDFRYDYPLRMLQLALDETAAEDGPARAVQTTTPMTTARLIAELQHGGLLDVASFPASQDRMQRFLAVPICIRKGILGIRLLLINRKDAPAFAAVKNLNDLKRLQAGQGFDWQDTRVLQHNGLPVVTSAGYEELFAMLAAKRFDYFPRGLHEPFRELEQRNARFQDMIVEDTLALQYPNPDYFFVRKDNLALAQRIQRGLERAIADGSYEALFQREFGDSVRRAKLAQRRVITLRNPDVETLPNADDPKRWLQTGRASDENSKRNAGKSAHSD